MVSYTFIFVVMWDTYDLSVAYKLILKLNKYYLRHWNEVVVVILFEEHI